MNDERCPQCGRGDGLHAQLFHRTYTEQRADGYKPCGRAAEGTIGDDGRDVACLRQADHDGGCVLPDPDGVTPQNPSGLMEIAHWPG